MPRGSISQSVPAAIGGICYAMVGTEASFGGAAVTSYNLIPDFTRIKRTSELVIDTGVIASIAIHETRKYSLAIPASMWIGGAALIKGKSGLWNPGGASVNESGRINLNLQQNAGAINGVTKTTGTVHTPNNIAEQNYTEVLSIDLPRTFFEMGDTLEIVVELEQTAHTADDLEIRLYTDPATKGNELIVHLQLT